jgi:hypothetical protein
VHLDPCPVEFPLDRRRPGLLQRGVHVRSGRREHGGDRPPDLEPELAQVLAGQRDRRDRPEVPTQHQRPPHVLDRHARGLRDGVPDHGGQRALPDVSQHERPQERLLGRRRPGHQRAQRRAPPGDRPRAGQRRHVRERRVHLGDGQRRLLRRGGRLVTERRPAHAEHALARGTREVARARHAFLRRQAPQRRRDPLDFPQPPRLGADVLCGGGELGEQHRV